MHVCLDKAQSSGDVGCGWLAFVRALAQRDRRYSRTGLHSGCRGKGTYVCIYVCILMYGQSQQIHIHVYIRKCLNIQVTLLIHK